MLKIQGWNPFYDGWLAGILKLPPSSEEEGYMEGYEMAEETGSPPWMLEILVKEIELGHIKVEQAG